MQIPLLIVAGLAFIAAFALRATKPDKAAFAWIAFAVGTVLAVAAVVAPRLATDDVKLEIVAPAEGATVAAGEAFEVEVEVEGAEIATSATDLTAGHIHVFVDGELDQMPSSSVAEVSLKPGTHEITVEYVDPEHLALDPPVRATVEVTAEKGG